MNEHHASSASSLDAPTSSDAPSAEQKAEVSPSPEARRRQIVGLIEREGEAPVDALAQRFGVSAMTIRRDLQDLAEEGLVLRTHGGAAASSRVSFEFRFLENIRRHAREKGELARVAASRVEPGQSVLLDSGTTTLAIARLLREVPDVRVMTTSLPIASELFGVPGLDVYLLGGQIRHDSPDLCGALTDHSLDVLCADLAFIGADAVDLAGNLYNGSAEVGRMLMRMAEAADRAFAVADHTKIGKRDLMRFADLRQWSGLITDDGLDAEHARQLRERGIALLTPSDPNPQPEHRSAARANGSANVTNSANAARTV